MANFDTIEGDIPSENRVMVFVDGNNLYHRLAERSWPTWINIEALAQLVVGSRDLIHTHYYNASPPAGRPHSKRTEAFLTYIDLNPHVTLRRARLQRTTLYDQHGGSYEGFIEKGADTALSGDVNRFAAEDKFDCAIIISNDSDYYPTAETLRDVYSKRVEVVYFEGSMPYVMQDVAVMRKFRRGWLDRIGR